MLSKIIIKKDNLISNLQQVKALAQGKVCFMVKANAYGHGLEEVVKVSQEYVDYYGVSNQAEAEIVRKASDKPVVVFGVCDDYFSCMANNIEFCITSFSQAKEIVKIYKNSAVIPKAHLCVNSGMNRYGIADTLQMRKIVSLFENNKIELAGLYTHFSSLTTDENYTQKQWEFFNQFISILPKHWETLVHIGGGGTIFRDWPIGMHRVGLFGYGYGNENLKPVLQVRSQIVDIQSVKQGQHIGYLCGFTTEKDMRVGVVPLGYGDGFPRKLSNNFTIEVNGKSARQIGNICMDAMMVDLTDVKAKIGDEVTIMKNASDLAGQLQTTEYEVLTNFSKFRGDRIIQ